MCPGRFSLTKYREDHIQINDWDDYYVQLVVRFAVMIKVLNSISVLIFSVTLLIIYAYMPVMVDLNVEGVRDLHKQTFFYSAFGGFVIVNILLRTGVAFGSRNLSAGLASWIRTIIFIVNFYLTSLTGFIGVMNNAASINPSSYAYLNYLGPVFSGIWMIGLIFFIFKKK